MTVFDAIISGALPASFVHRDERCVAFLDIHPINRGHTLVVPLQSVKTLDEVDADTRAHLWEVARRIGIAQRQGLGSLAQHFLVNDGRAASQTVPHVHVHVIPRYANDHARTMARMLWHLAAINLRRRNPEAGRADLDAAAAAIRAALATT